MARSRTVLVAVSLCAIVSWSGCSKKSSPPTAPPPGAPAAPTGVAASAGAASIVLSWNPVSGADSYNVYTATSPGVTKAGYASLPGGVKHTGVSSPLSVTSLTNGTTYYFVVTATGPGGESVESAEVSATPMAAGATAPVTGEATAITESSVQLAGSFTNPAGFVTSAWFEYGATPALGATTAASNYAAPGPIPVTATLTGLPGGTTFHYRLATQNSDGVFSGAVKTFRTLFTPQVLASGLNAPVWLHLRAGEAWWVEVYGRAVKKVPTTGGPVTVIATSPMGGNQASLTFDALSVYWADYRTIWKSSLMGGPVTTLVSDRNDMRVLRHHASELYWREHRAIVKMSIAGGAVDTLVTGSDQIQFQGDLLVDATGMYWSSYYGGTIHWRGLGGGPEVVLALGLTEPHFLIHEGGQLYWADQTGVRRMPDTGGAITTIVATGYYVRLRGLDKDATHIYWADDAGSIRRSDLFGATIETLAVGQVGSYSSAATDLHVDDLGVYWIMPGSYYNPPLGEIRRLPK